MQFILVIERTIAVEPGLNIAVSKQFLLPFAPYIGLRLFENKKEYIISDRLTYNMDYRCFADAQMFHDFGTELTVEEYTDNLKSSWDTVKVVRY